jgi:hypothetical protein
MNPSVSNHSANCPGVCELTYQPGAVAKKSGNGCLSGHHVTNIVSRHLIKSNHKGDSKRLNQQHEDCTANLKALNLISNLGTFWPMVSSSSTAFASENAAAASQTR